jgi:hypothetical protein
MVEFITYKGSKYPIRVSYYVLLMAQKESGVGMDDLDKDFEAQQHILWYALVAGHKMAAKDLTIPREDMVWVLDECYMEFQQAMYGFAKSLIDIQTEAFKQQEKIGQPKKK